MDTNVSPKVSVLMPVYNAALYLREAMDSILNQKFTDFEFLILNDGSTDTSEEIVESYGDARIRYVKNKKNLGLVDTLNKGIDLARGMYIARMDADDISLPGRLARQVDFMDQNSDMGACGTAYQYFGEADRVISPPGNFKESFTLLSSTSCLGHPTSMLRKSVLDQYALRYENEYQDAEDYALWIRMSWVSRLSSLPETLLLYRWHAGNKSKTDVNCRLARAKARTLWYELLLRRPLEESQKSYLKEDLDKWEAFMGAKKMLRAVLEHGEKAPAIEREFYGKTIVTDWEIKIIDHFGLRGLATCLLPGILRRWSHATRTGLVAHYLSKRGIRLK